MPTFRLVTASAKYGSRKIKSKRRNGGTQALREEAGAAMLVDVPVGASPAGGACSVTTVGMPDNGKGDRPVESSGVKVSDGWGKARSDPPGRQANRQAVANSEPGKPRNDSPIGSG